MHGIKKWIERTPSMNNWIEEIALSVCCFSIGDIKRLRVDPSVPASHGDKRECLCPKIVRVLDASAGRQHHRETLASEPSLFETVH